MKLANTIIGLFALVSLGALTLWALSDLWIVLAILLIVLVIHFIVLVIMFIIWSGLIINMARSNEMSMRIIK